MPAFSGVVRYWRTGGRPGRGGPFGVRRNSLGGLVMVLLRVQGGPSCHMRRAPDNQTMPASVRQSPPPDRTAPTRPWHMGAAGRISNSAKGKSMGPSRCHPREGRDPCLFPGGYDTGVQGTAWPGRSVRGAPNAINAGTRRVFDVMFEKRMDCHVEDSLQRSGSA